MMDAWPTNASSARTVEGDCKMDELAALGFELQESIRSCLLECYETIQDAVTALKCLLYDFSENMSGLAEKPSELMDSILIEDYGKKWRRKWPIPKNERYRPTMFYRRLKVHRCRNNC